VVVLGILQAKDAAAIARGLSSVASAIVATQPTVIGKRSLSAADMARALAACGFTGELVVEPEPAAAVTQAQELATASGTSVLVTGSMYLAGQVRRRWYPDDEIVIQRTPWPEACPAAPLDVA
jgi:folylpolyglutamate synthase/dihydropteroate synthase